MFKYGLRNRQSFNDIIIYLDNQPTIKYPNINATKIMNSYFYGNINSLSDAYLNSFLTINKQTQTIINNQSIINNQTSTNNHNSWQSIINNQTSTITK